MYKILKNELNTKYLIGSLESELRNLLDSYDKWDLVDCKFGPTCERLLRSYYRTHSFINSGDEVLNKVLEHNCESQRLEPINFIDLKTTFSNDEFIDYIRGLDRTKAYKIPDNDHSEKAICLVILIQMLIPDVVIEVGGNMLALYEKVKDGWANEGKHYDAYWILEGMALYKVDVVDGKVYLKDGRVFNEADFVRLFNPIPYDFGTKRVADDPAFENLWYGCLDVINRNVVAEKTMMDFI